MGNRLGGDRTGEPAMRSVMVISTTYPDLATAEDRSRRLVAAGVAACVQMEGPVASTYSWEGAIECAEEWCCRCKTSHRALAACIEAIQTSHPYSVPEITWSEVAAADSYVAWVEAVTRDDAAGKESDP